MFQRLRGVEGSQFKINNTIIPTDLEIKFKSSNTGKFANLYKNVAGKVKLLNVTEKGVNPLVSDVNKDGYINAKDSLIILKRFLGIE